MVQYFKIALASLALSAFISCDSALWRVPVVTPYELTSADRGYTCFLNLRFPEQVRDRKEVSLDSSTDSIGVADSIIVAYTSLIYLPGEMTEAWFVADLSKNQEKVFTRKEEYRAFLNETQIDSVPMHNPKVVMMDYNAGRGLPWK